MTTNYFAKPAQTRLTGIQKIAILLGELGTNASEGVLENVNFTDKQLKDIRVAMRNLGMYDPWDQNKSSREVEALQEVYNFGAMKGILVPNPGRYVEPPIGYVKVTEPSPQNEIRQTVQNDPDAIAKVLSSWLSEGKE